MYIQILVAIFIGVNAGVITGLIPGIHINLISAIITLIALKLTNILNLTSISTIIISMSITHTFLDVIPSIYLGAPNESNILMALPGHKFLLKGKGHYAVKLTAIGSFLSCIYGILLTPLFSLIIIKLYPILKQYIGYLLIITFSIIIFSNPKKKILPSLTFFLISGYFGYIILNIKTLTQPLFHPLSGLFGISLLILSLNDSNKIPKQDYKDINQTKSEKETKIKKGTIAATTIGFISAFLPGFGASHAAIIAQKIFGKIGDDGFLLITGGLSTVNFTLSLITFFMLDKARNGSIIAVKTILKQITIHHFITFLLVTLITSSIALILVLKVSKVFSKLITKINYKKLVIIIISFITLLSFLFDGFIGIIILSGSISLGLLANHYKIAKNNLMGLLILNTILYLII